VRNIARGSQHWRPVPSLASSARLPPRSKTTCLKEKITNLKVRRVHGLKA